MFARQKNLKLKALNKGVTLIELLVVITIMMTMMTLVAPLAIETVDKAEAQSEYLSFCSLLRRASVKAFANGSGIQVELKEQSLRVTAIPTNIFANEQQQTSENNAIFEHTYKFLHFKEVQLILNRNGMPNIETINLTQRHKNRALNIIDLLDN